MAQFVVWGYFKTTYAVIAQLVERVPSKYKVAGSNPVYRSILPTCFPLIAYMYMQMDINKIFNLFDGSSLENKAEEASDTIIIQETPMFWIGMFKKIILNNYVFYHQIKNHLPEDVIKQIDGGDDLANMVTYSRAWFYISKVDLKRRVDVDALFTFMDKDLLHTTKMAIRYFEGVEEYEKCAHIKQIQDIIEKMLDKT